MSTTWQLIAKQIGNNPDSNCIVYEGKSLTYKELDVFSQKLAHHLTQLESFRSNPLVPVFLERSLWFPVVACGIWRAGGVYVPIDPLQPKDRLIKVLEDTGASFIITDHEHKQTECRVDQYLIESVFKGQDVKAFTEAAPSPLAYVLFTSGSTGIPKGVQISHKALLNHLESIKSYWLYNKPPVGAALTPFVFDVSVWEIFSVLTEGGTLHMMPHELSYQPAELIERVIEKQIDQLYIPPGMVPDIARKVAEENISLPLKRILFGVEPLKPEYLSHIQKACDQAILLNGYGPTEATVCCTIFPFTGDKHPYEVVPIGWAMPGYQIRLVGDQNSQPGPGELGEIWVGGDSVSDGYLLDDELNERAFHTDEEGIRWFKTGDLALRMGDGAIIFSGRVDQQIKIRGYKVEPVEIELTINKYPGIDESAVVQMTNENGFRYLVAFAGSSQDEEIRADQVMWFIADRLPDYMIPSKLTIMSSLPRNLSGKIDRSALAEMHQLEAKTPQEPETDLEKKILKCWKEVLKRDDIGITDSYFQFGANSLSAARIAAKIEVKTGKQCRIGLLSKYPTVQLLARKLEASGLDFTKDEEIVDLSKDRIPVTPTQEELLFLHEVDPDGRTHNILTRFEIKSACDPECLMQAIKNFIERQPSLHLKFLRDHSQWYQEPIKGFRCQLPFRSIVDEDETERKRIIDQTIQQVGRIAFDIFKGPMQSGFLLQLEPDRYEFIWSVHHLVFDGWSMSIMLRGIRDAIGGKLIDHPVAYASWIRENLLQFSQTTPQQIEDRINKLEPFAFPLTFPVISHGYSNMITDGGRTWFTIPRALQLQLEKMAVASGSTLFNVLYTAYGLLLSLYSGKSSFMIGTPYANRHTALADQVTGYGITVLPLGFKADFSASFEDNLHANSRLTEEGYDLTYVAPGQIVKPLNKKVPGHSGSLLQAMFILQNWEHHDEPGDPVRLVQTDIGNQTAKMLITLNAEQVDNGLECWFEYQLRQLDKEHIDRMATEFVELLQTAVIDPHQPLRQIRNRLVGQMPVPASHPAAAFISETSLGLWAVKHWLDEGGTVAAIMSNHGETLKFAREQGIRIIPYGRKNLSQFKETGIDYLFSIVNSFILKPEILEVPRLGAINYHDSPLPELAGVYATSWALLEGRNEHAISWHYMVPGTDEGDLIVQKKFALEPGITVFELDTICYEKAQTGFREMVEMIHKGKPAGKKQQGKGSYNGLHKKPPLGGIVSFDRPGEQIILQYRAMAFNARYPNPLCSLKIPFGEDFVYPQKIQFISGKTADQPGTLISHDGRKLVFSCTNGTIEVHGPETRMRQALDHALLASLWMQTDRITTQQIIDSQINLWIEKLSMHEKKWVSFFESQPEPVNLEPLPPESEYFTEEINLEGLSDHALAIAITVFLRMIDPAYTFGIAVQSGAMSTLQKMLTETILPFQFGHFDPDDFITMFEEASQKLLEATPENAYLKDIFFRYPQLRSQGWNGPQYHWTLYPGSAGDGHMQVGDIHILNGRVRIRQARVKGRFIDVPEWSYRFSRLAQFFNPERFGDIIPGDVLFLPAEKAEIMPEIVWGYRSLGEWFVEMALTWPDKPALIQDDRSLTFEGTLMMIRRIAFALKQQEPGPHTIAVSIERSPEAIIAQLAIYMLGYTYVPVDPHNPESRIRYVLEKSKPALLLTTRELYPDLKPLSPVPVKLWDDLVASKELIDFKPVPEEAIAYMLFTSGSTGEPKGVPIHYGALSRFIQDSIYRYNLTHLDVGLQFASMAFDASMEEIFPILLTGASLVIRTEEWLGSIGGFLDKLQHYKISFLDLPTAYWQILVRDMHKSRQLLPETVRQVIIGGDYAQPSTFQMWREMYPEFPVLVNTYGPTEATVVCVAWDKTLAPENDKALPIGLPVNSLKSRLVLANGLDAPPGIPGELWMAGPTLSPGYYENPTLSDKKWVQAHGERWYRTGDWVHRNSAGVMYFIGRQDDQIKVGGFLVDLNEVLKVLSQLDGVREAAVRAIAKGEQKIIVGYVYYPSGAPDESYLKERMAQSLPAYMVPSRIMAVDEIPYNQNNKVDWRKLPVPEQLTSAAAEGDAAELSDPLEARLQKLWQEHLGLTYLDPNANFFDLGLSSLTAVSVLSDLEGIIGRPIPLAMLLEYPSVKTLARGLQEDEAKAFFRPLVKIKPGGSKRPLFIIHGAGLNVLLFNTLKDLMDPEQPIYGIQAKGMDGESPILTKLDDIIESYMAEIKSVQANGPYALAGFSLGGLIAFELGRQMTERGDKVDFIGVFDTFAESSYRSWSASRKRWFKLIWNWNKLWYNVGLILKEPVDVIPKKIKWIRFKLRRKMTGNRVVLGEDLQDLPDKLFHIANATIKAVSALELKVYPGKVYVFRAAHRNFYIPDQQYLGWKPYARSGVVIKNIPGDHSHIFAEPNDTIFAKVLQEALDESYEEWSKGD